MDQWWLRTVRHRVLGLALGLVLGIVPGAVAQDPPEKVGKWSDLMPWPQCRHSHARPARRQGADLATHGSRRQAHLAEAAQRQGEPPSPLGPRQSGQVRRRGSGRSQPLLRRPRLHGRWAAARRGRPHLRWPGRPEGDHLRSRQGHLGPSAPHEPRPVVSHGRHAGQRRDARALRLVSYGRRAVPFQSDSPGPAGRRCAISPRRRRIWLTIRICTSPPTARSSWPVRSGLRGISTPAGMGDGRGSTSGRAPGTNTGRR